MRDPLDDLRARYSYRVETRDRWTILSAPVGWLSGDCDDFALTAAWLLAGRSIWRMLWWIATFRLMPWSTVTEWGAPHMALWVRGRGWICNIHPEFGPCRHRLRLPYILPLFLAAALAKGLQHG